MNPLLLQLGWFFHNLYIIWTLGEEFIGLMCLAKLRSMYWIKCDFTFVAALTPVISSRFEVNLCPFVMLNYGQIQDSSFSLWELFVLVIIWFVYLHSWLHLKDMYTWSWKCEDLFSFQTQGSTGISWWWLLCCLSILICHFDVLAMAMWSRCGRLCGHRL